MRLRDISKKLNSSLEMRMLVTHVTELSNADLISVDDIDLTAQQKLQLDDFIQQRLNGRPISKIIGKKEFYGREFIVNDDVLDPRPDSETLIEAILKRNHNNNTRILDLGAGSGCLILTLLAELPNAMGMAVDISSKALEIAEQNAENLGVQSRVQFAQSDWFESIEDKFDIIISNPPYIESKVILDLDIDVRDYDPNIALDGGGDGLNPYRVILPQVKQYLNHGGMIALEHGYDQCGRIKRLVENEGFIEIKCHQDLGGHDRVISAIHK